MTLSEEVKNKITEILGSQEFMSNLYEGLSEAQRKKLGMVYTPASICIQMIESFDCESLANKTILDPACGSGNLLIACLIAGADTDKLYGNEYDKVAVDLCRKRITRACSLLGKPYIKDWQIHQGDATQARCLTDFSPSYRYQEYVQVDLFSSFF